MKLVGKLNMYMTGLQLREGPYMQLCKLGRRLCL